MFDALFSIWLGLITVAVGFALLDPPAFQAPMRLPPPWGRRSWFHASARRLRDRLNLPGLVCAAAGVALGLSVHSHPVAVALGAAALFAPGWLRRRRHAARRRDLLLELGDAVEYLELHFAAGATVPDAIAGTAAFLVGPLAGELRRVLARAALLQDGPRALDALTQRLADPDLTAVARRLSAAWRLRAPGPDTFAGFGDTLRHLRETHIAARTKTLPVVYVAIAGWMLFALVAIVAVPAGTAFLHSLSSF